MLRRLSYQELIFKKSLDAATSWKPTLGQVSLEVMVDGIFLLMNEHQPRLVPAAGTDDRHVESRQYRSSKAAILDPDPGYSASQEDFPALWFTM